MLTSTNHLAPSANAVAPPELMRSLGRLVRGLSALFWGLPTAVVICVRTSKAEVLKPYDSVSPLVATGLLVFGLWQLGAFQKQERIWRNALDRALVLGLINLGLSPFLYWSNRIPANPFFANMEIVMAGTGLLFVASLNIVLQRLSAMLPDETLRLETKQFTSLNLTLLGAMCLLGAAYLVMSRLADPPLYVQIILTLLDNSRPGMLATWPGFWLLILLVLLPLAMTMALLWKTKEVILDNVFGGQA
jgi:hypothetical protein